MAKSMTGIGVPKTNGGHTASVKIGGFFCSFYHDIVLLGQIMWRAICSPVPVGPVRQSAWPALFLCKKGGI